MSEDRIGKAHRGQVKEWRVVIPCDPPKKTHQQELRVGITNNGKARMYTHKGLRNTWLALLMSVDRPPSPLEGPILLDIEVTWPWLVKDKKARATAKMIPHDQKPDWENMAKGLCDAMTTAGWWNDDKQVYAARVVQWRGDVPGVIISAESVDPLSHS